MFCRNCGMKLMVGVSTCPACGKSIKKTSNEPAKAYNPHELNTNIIRKENDKPKKNYGIVFILIILGLLIIIGILKLLEPF